MIASPLLRRRWGIMHYAQISTVIQACAELIGALSVAYGVVKSVPFLWARYKLVEEFRAERSMRIGFQRRAEIAEATVEALQDMITGWEQVREEVRTLRSQFGSAILWIADAMHARDVGHTDLPPIPDDLTEAVHESLRRRGGS